MSWPQLIKVPLPTMPPSMTRHMSIHARPSRGGTRDLIHHQTSISPNVGVGSRRRATASQSTSAGTFQFRKQTRRVRTQRALKQIASTLRSRCSPKGIPIHSREQMKKPIQETSGPVTLIHSHDTMKLRIFTDLNKRRKGTFPEKVTITIRSTTKPTWKRLTLTLPSKNHQYLHKSDKAPEEKSIPNASNHNTVKQCLISLSKVRRVRKLLRPHNIQKVATTEALSGEKVGRDLLAPSIQAQPNYSTWANLGASNQA